MSNVEMDNPFISMATETPAWARGATDGVRMRSLLIDALILGAPTKAIIMPHTEFLSRFPLKNAVGALRNDAKKVGLKLKIVVFEGKVAISATYVSEKVAPPVAKAGGKTKLR